MKLGLHRLVDPILGDAARVDGSAGDAAPYLSRYLYELLEFEPEFECLPLLPRIPTKDTASGQGLPLAATKKARQQGPVPSP